MLLGSQGQSRGQGGKCRGAGRGRRTAGCEVAWGWGRCFLHFAGVRVDPRLLSGIAPCDVPGVRCTHASGFAGAEPGAGRKVQIRGAGRGRRTAAFEVFFWGEAAPFFTFCSSALQVANSLDRAKLESEPSVGEAC